MERYVELFKESFKLPKKVIDIIGNKSWYDPKQDHKFQSMLDHAQNKSEGYKKYIYFVLENGHITHSASSVFREFIDENYKNLTLAEVKDALSDLWSDTDESSKYNLESYASRRGIK